MADDNQTLPPQKLAEPGKEGLMNPRPQYRGEGYKAAGKLAGKVAIITGGDSGIGRSVAVLFAREGADVAILYLDQHQDAEQTRKDVEQHGRRCLT
ncbi:MAG TPA: NAD(P)-dependent oxidoreductase, partial [Pseudomonas sp.]|nr:NAD(P)-dependent oxidoreductase [Pseudomonas sp.]